MIFSTLYHKLDDFRAAVKDPRLPIVDVTQAAKFFFGLPNASGFRPYDLTNIAPPFKEFFLFSDLNADWMTGDWGRELIASYVPFMGGQMGLHVRAYDLPPGYSIKVPTLNEIDESTCNLDSATRWGLHASLWFVKGPHFSQPMDWFGIANESGTLRIAYSRPVIHDADEATWGEDAQVFLGFITGMLVGLTFMHCKTQISFNDGVYTRPERRRAERDASKLFEYKVLNVKPLAQMAARSISNENGLSAINRLHICRGHFATYTSERPLFGKHVGTYWVPQHVRGSAEAGEIVKDYSVKVPS